MPIDIRSVLAVELAFALATLFTGTPPADDIRLPNPPAVPQPMPPAPPPATSTLTVARDTLYMFDADVPVLVLTSPAGLVTVTEEKGPVRVRGRFADGAGKVETRTFAGKSVFSVEPVASGRVEILVVPVGAASADKVVRRTVDVDAGEAPRPPPPDPKPPEPPKPPAPPVPAKTFQVLIVIESGATYTAAQNSVIYGKAVEDYLTGRCTGGKAGWGRRDQNTDPATDTSGLKALWAAVKPSVTSTPALAIAANEKVTLEPLPATPADAVALLKKYAGDK